MENPLEGISFQGVCMLRGDQNQKLAGHGTTIRWRLREWPTRIFLSEALRSPASQSLFSKKVHQLAVHFFRMSPIYGGRAILCRHEASPLDQLGRPLPRRCSTGEQPTTRKSAHHGYYQTGISKGGSPWLVRVSEARARPTTPSFHCEV